jgi:predicted XRE-type DNA-binding protein
MAKNWRDVRAAAKLDETAVAKHRKRLDEEVRAFGLADLRRRRSLTQADLAEALGVRQPRVSQIEHGDIDHTEVATLRAYVAALGGRLEVVATFGDEHLGLA